MDAIEKQCYLIGERLRDTRKAAGVSRRGAGMRAQLSRETIYRMETGETRGRRTFRGPTLDTLMRYSLAVGIEMRDLLPTLKELREACLEQAKRQQG